MTSKLDFFQQKLPSPANELRAQLQFLEDAALGLSGCSRTKLLDYFARLDQVQALFEALQVENGPDLRPEQVQFETIQTRFHHQASPILYRLGGPDKLRQLRPQTAGPDTHPWWFVDRHVAERSAQQTRRLIRLGSVIAVLGLIIVILLNTVFKPDPAVVASRNLYDTAMSALINRDDNRVVSQPDSEAALLAINEALVIQPNNLEALILKGVILDLLDQPTEAAELYQQAEEVSPRPELIFIGRGRILLQLDRFEPALALAEEAIAINPDSAEAWFLAGQAHERLGDIEQAFQEMSLASDLALEQGDQTLYAIIRVNIGYLSPGGAR